VFGVSAEALAQAPATASQPAVDVVQESDPVRRVRAGQAVVAALMILIAVLSGAHVLQHGATNARAAGVGYVDQGQGSCHDASGSDTSRPPRHRAGQSVGNLLEPESWPPEGGTAAAFTGAAAFDERHDGYRTASRYHAGVPSPDTSPAALEVFRC